MVADPEWTRLAADAPWSSMAVNFYVVARPLTGSTLLTTPMVRFFLSSPS